MGNGFDHITRITATPMSPGQRIKLLGRAILRPKRTKKRKKLDASGTAARLRLAYLARDNSAYRTEVFGALLLLRRANEKELQEILNALVTDAKEHGADGIETLILASVDAATVRSAPGERASTRAKIRSSLAPLKGNLKFWSAASPPNMKIPLGHVSSPLVLDVRADAIRTLFQELVRQNSAEQDIQTILELLDAKPTQAAICKQPELENQLGHASAADETKQDNCEKHGSAGGKGQGSVAGTLGDLTMSGCLLLVADETDTLTERLKAVDKCMAQLAQPAGVPHPHSGDVGEPITITLTGILIGAAVAAVYEVGLLMYEKYVIDPDVEKTQELKAYAKAVRDYWSAVDREAKAEEGARAADDNLKQKNEALESAKAALDQSSIEPGSADEAALKDAVKDAQNAVTTAKNEKDKADAELKEARENTPKKKTAAMEALPVSDGLDPEDPFSSPECQAAFGDLNDQLLRDKLGKDWKDWNARLRRVSNPNPTIEGSPYDALQMDICGIDGATTNDRSAHCLAPVDCPSGKMPDENCGCKGTPTSEARLFAKMAANACSEIHCIDDASSATAADSGGGKAILRGVVCGCVAHNTEGAPPPAPRPRPVVIATVFGNGSTPAPGVNSPTARVVGKLFRDLGTTHMSETPS